MAHLQTNITGEKGKPETHKLTVTLPFEGARIFLEIPAPGLLFAQDENPARKWELMRRAIEALRSKIPAQ